MKSYYEHEPWEATERVPSETSTVEVVFNVLGDRIEDEQGTTTPEFFTFIEVPNDPAAPIYVVECVQEDGGAPRVKDVHVHKRSVRGSEIRSVDLRRLRPLEDVLEVAWAAVASRRAPTATGAGGGQIVDIEQEFRAKKLVARGLRKTTRRTKMTPERLDEIAEIYRANIASGPGAANRAVKERFNIADKTVFRYVQLADEREREAGRELRP